MLNVKKIEVGLLGENAYILEYENGAVLVDPGADVERITEALGGKPCLTVLLTHAHVDHIGAVAALQRAGAKVALHEADLPLLRGPGNLAAAMGLPLEPFEPDVLLQGGEVLPLGVGEVRVLHTPGHTAGSVCYAIGDLLFSGDTLFYDSVGRTDFPSGDPSALQNSLRNVLFKLEGDYTVYPGHGPATTLLREKASNPYA